ncbi:MAG TPA: anti-sigma factor [Candidatus Limnocylindrales bacterium]
MDHAAAHERIEDLILEPGRLAALADSIEPDDVALREHLAGCPTCSADLDGWERLQARLTEALPHSADAAAAAVVPVELPPSLRARVISAARSDARARSGRRTGDPAQATLRIARLRSRRAVATWVGLAASLVVLVGATIITVDQVARRSTAEAEARAISAALSAVDRVLAVPDHRISELRTQGGVSAGSVSWSRHDWVVLTTALAKPSSDQRYRCWLENGDSSVAIGEMDFVGDTAFWVASLNEWATWELGPTTKFVVTLEPADGSARTGPTVLAADLGSS